MSVRSLVTTRGVIALAVAPFLIGVTMGFALGADLANVGHAILGVGNALTGGDLNPQNYSPANVASGNTNYGALSNPIMKALGSTLPASSPQPQPSGGINSGAVTNQNTNTNTNTGGGIAPSGTVGGGMNQNAYLDAIQQQYGNAIQGYTGEKANALAANPINLQDVQNTFDLQKNAAQNQVQNQVNTYNTQRSGIQSQQQLSLAQLADMIRGQHQGLQAQLGATGAGSSSAALMGDYALAHQQNQNAAAINTQAGGNVANVNAQIQQVQNTLDPYLQNLEGQKQQQLHNIMSNYNDLMARLESSIGQAQGEEKARLALFGQTLTQAAQDSLSALNQGVAQQKQAYADSINNAKSAAPAYQAPALKEAPAAVQAPNLSPFQINSGAGNATAEPGIAGGSLAKILEQQQQAAIA